LLYFKVQYQKQLIGLIMTDSYTINISMECADSAVFASTINSFNKALFSKGIDFDSKFTKPKENRSPSFNSTYIITFNENVLPNCTSIDIYRAYLKDILTTSLKNTKNREMVKIQVDDTPTKLLFPPAKPKKIVKMESANFQKGPIDRLSSHLYTNNNKKVKLENINLMRFVAKCLYDTTFKIHETDGKIQTYDGEDEKHFIAFFENLNTQLILTSEIKIISDVNRKRLTKALKALIETSFQLRASTTSKEV
jgi:hypothetical protein